MRLATTAALVLACAGVAGCGANTSDPPNAGTPPSDVVTLTDENFDAAVVKSRDPVLVDFWAAWCRPCLDMKPAVRAAAAELRGRAVVGEIDTEANAFTAQKYGVETLPALLLFQDGEVVGRFEGPRTRETLVEDVERTLATPTEGATR
jgi:thioredoxin 1